MLVDLHAHRFWDDPKLEQEEVVSAGHDELMAEMERANAEKLAKLEKEAPRPTITVEEMRRRAIERARLLRERMMPRPRPAAEGEAPEGPMEAAEEAEEAPAAARRPPASGRPGRGALIPPAGRDEDWEDVVDDDYSGS